MKRYIIPAMGLAVLFALSACGQNNGGSQPTAETTNEGSTFTQTAPDVTAAPDQPVTLNVGETVSIPGTGISVKLIAVTEDSRCPQDVECDVAGQVTVNLSVTTAMTVDQSVSLTLGGPQGSAMSDLGEYMIELIAVDPYPTSQASIAPQDYRATIQLTAK